jgi:hypothetical protein
LGKYMSNVVIGTALNYSVEHIKNFILSFRKFNSEDDIILIYNLNDVSKIQSFAENNNVKLIGFDPHDMFPGHVVSTRFLKYLDTPPQLAYNPEWSLLHNSQKYVSESLVIENKNI